MKTPVFRRDASGLAADGVAPWGVVWAGPAAKVTAAKTTRIARLCIGSPQPEFTFGTRGRFAFSDHESFNASPSRLGRGRWGGANSAAKWAPAKSINPERKAQNMSVTEIEKGPYASWKSSQGSAFM